MKNYDFFVSHAREEKELFASPLVILLSHYGFDVWFDRTNISLGEEIFETIEEGIQKSSFGVFILSKNFIEKKWPMHELDLFLKKEQLNKRNNILPIFYDISKEIINEKIPELHNKAFEKIDHSNFEFLNLNHICDRLIGAYFSLINQDNDWIKLSSKIMSLQNKYYNSLSFLIYCCEHPISDLRISIIEFHNVIGYAKSIYDTYNVTDNKNIIIAYNYAKEKYKNALDLNNTVLFDEFYTCKIATMVTLSELIKSQL